MKTELTYVDASGFKYVKRDIPYCDQSPNQKMDIYFPNDTVGPFPLIIFTHGGGFLGGRKDHEGLAGILKAVSQGFALASVGYRLSMEAKWPESVYDVKCALRYLTAHAKELNLDFCAAYHASPMNLLRDTFPPALFQHGTQDNIVPVTDSMKFNCRINDQAGQGTAVLELFEGVRHGSPSFYTEENVLRNLRFIDEKIGRQYKYSELPEIKTCTVQVDDGLEFDG